MCIYVAGVSSAAIRIVSEQAVTYIYAQNCQLQEPCKNMPATKGVFEEVAQKELLQFFENNLKSITEILVEKWDIKTYVLKIFHVSSKKKV